MKKFINILIGSVLVTMLLGIVFSSNIAKAAYLTYGNFIHLVGSTGVPSIAAGGGAGVAPSVSNTGTDMAGNISVTAGAAAASNDAVVTLTFRTPYATTPFCSFEATNSSAALLSGLTMTYHTTTTTTYAVNSLTTGLNAGSTYTWDYVCAQ